MGIPHTAYRTTRRQLSQRATPADAPRRVIGGLGGTRVAMTVAMNNLRSGQHCGCRSVMGWAEGALWVPKGADGRNRMSNRA